MDFCNLMLKSPRMVEEWAPSIVGEGPGGNSAERWKQPALESQQGPLSWGWPGLS